MKKIIVLLLCFSIFFSALPVTAETTDPTIVVGSAECQVGETVEIPVSLQNNPGIFALSVKVVYDASKLKYNGATVNKKFSSSVEEGKKIVITSSNLKYNGEIFTLSFTVLEGVEAGETTVSLSYENGDVCNAFEEDISLKISSGKINVQNEVIVPGDVDNDSVVNLNDLITLAQYVAGWDIVVNKEQLDVNGDKVVDLNDVTHLARYMAGWKEIFLS